MEERSRGLEQSGTDTGNPMSAEIEVKCPFRSSLSCPDTCLQFQKAKEIRVGDGTGKLADGELPAVRENRDSFVRNVRGNELRLSRCAKFNT